MKIIIFGIGGRMGSAIYELATKEGIEVVAGIDAFADKLSLPVPVYKSLRDCKEKADVLIDFSRPTGLSEILEYITTTLTPAVLCTTGYSDEQQKAVDEASKKVAIFQSSNMSLGINLLIDLSKRAGQFLGTSYDIEIIEQHHNRKVDAPSGTALSIAKAINEVYDNGLNFVYGRNRESGKRQPKDLGIHAIRGGTIVGKHDVMFIGSEEILTIAHSAQSPSVFAIGALRAADYISARGAGKYSMDDLIGRDYSVTTVKGITDIALVSFYHLEYGEIPELFNNLANAKISVDMISQAPSSRGYAVTFSINTNDIAKVREIFKDKCTVRENLSQLVIAGVGMEHQSGVANMIINALVEAHIEVCSTTTGATEISCALPTDSIQTAVDTLRTKFNIEI